MSVRVVFETHSTSEDNERGVASGWRGSHLSETGRAQAEELGRRRRDDGVELVITSDLARAVETARIAFEETEIPVLLDWRLRECNYGSLDGMPREQLEAERNGHIDDPWPGGESWRAAVARVGGLLDELVAEEAGRVVLIGHIATHWALEQRAGATLEQLAATPFLWQPGWEYSL